MIWRFLTVIWLNYVMFVSEHRKLVGNPDRRRGIVYDCSMQ